MAEITFPGPSPYGNQLRHEAVRAAVAELGITDDVEIEWFPIQVPPGIAGDHRGIRDPDGRTFHRIRLSVWDGPHSISKTLWHELEHARQNEAIGYDTYNHAYNFGNKLVGYDDNPFEQQARECEEAHVDVQLTDGSRWDPTVPQAAWNSMEAFIVGEGGLHPAV